MAEALQSVFANDKGPIGNIVAWRGVGFVASSSSGVVSRLSLASSLARGAGAGRRMASALIIIPSCNGLFLRRLMCQLAASSCAHNVLRMTVVSWHLLRAAALGAFVACRPGCCLLTVGASRERSLAYRPSSDSAPAPLVILLLRKSCHNSACQSCMASWRVFTSAALGEK